MNSKLSREKVQWLHDAAEEAAAVGIKLTMNPNELLMFTSALLAAMDSEPVMFCSEETLAAARDGEHLLRTLSSPSGECVIPLYRHAQPAPECEPVKRVNADQMQLVCLEANRHLDKYGAMAREVNKLLGRIPAQQPVVPLPDVVNVLLNHHEDVLPDDAFNLIDVKAWNAVSMLTCPDACRAAILQAGNSPVIPDGYVMVPKEPTAEMIAAAMNCEDVLFNSDDSFCVQFGNIYEAMLAAAPQEVY